VDGIRKGVKGLLRVLQVDEDCTPTLVTRAAECLGGRELSFCYSTPPCRGPVSHFWLVSVTLEGS
jgi:hypothetical protein